MKTIIFILLFSISLFANVAEVSIVKGKAFLLRDNNKIALHRGDTLEAHDIIDTQKYTKIQIVFEDKTIVTLGPKTHFSIDKYSAQAGKEAVNLGVTRGVFKILDGKIGRMNPRRFKVKTKSATIGIRGTYFAGNIKDDVETIGCLKGTIVVKNSAESVEVESGNMVEIHPGQKMQLKKLEMDKFEVKVSQKVKAILKNIAALSISSNLQFNKAEIRKIVNEIAAIEDVDEKRNLEDYFNNQIGSIFQEGLKEGSFVQTDVEKFYTTGYNGKSSSYVPLKWGYWSLKKPLELSASNAKEALENAEVFQIYLVRSDDEIASTTDEQKIKELMGYNSTEGKIYAHWDGNSQSRTYAEYSGKVLAVSDANTFTTTPTFPDDYNMNDFSVLDPTATNAFTLNVDYGNRYWYGRMNFDIKNAKSGEDETYSLYFVSLGSSAVNSTGLKQLLYFLGRNTPTLSAQTDVTQPNYPVKIELRYYGDNVEQIAGTFKIFRKDNSEVYGNTILNSDKVTAMKKIEVEGSDNIFKWGYWAQESPQDSSTDAIVAANPKGGWIVPNGIDQTTESEINTLMNSSAKASYSVEIIGTIHDPLTALSESKADSAAVIQNGSANFDFDFGQKTFSCSISFSDGSGSESGNWNSELTNAKVTASGFSANKANISGGNVIDAELNGKFYGSTAQNIGGGFEMIRSGNGKVAIAAFKGEKQ